jgi:2-oxoglutarate ferredoxin oxidoreductase subunit beta
MTYLVMDNEVYGMTKGQPSPTTASDWNSKIAPGGTGISPFSPLAVALAAGANFIARGFTGDPNGVAKMLSEAIQHPGFSFVQVLSPCITYRPEQKFWKKTVHRSTVEPTNNPADAGHRLLSDDGFTTGVFYIGERSPYAATVGPDRGGLEAIEEALQL